MKRLIKKAGVWWDLNMPGVASDNGHKAIIEDQQVTVYNEKGEAERTFPFNKLHLTPNSSQEQIRTEVMNVFTTYLNHE